MSSGKQFLWFISALALIVLASAEAPRALTFLPGLTGLAFYALQWKETGTKPALPKDILYIFLAVLTLGAFSALWAVDPSRALERTLKTAPILLSGCLLLSCAVLVERKYIRDFGWLIPAAASLAAFVVAADMLFHFPVYKLVHGMSAHQHVDVHDLNRAAIAVTLVLFPAWALTTTSRYKHVLRAALALPALIIFTQTDSQSVQLGLILGVIFTFAFPYRSLFARGLLTGIICAAAALAPWLATGAFTLFRDSLGKLSDTAGLANANMGPRMEIWDFVGRYVLKNPLFGQGMEATRDIPDFDTARLFYHSATVLHPHNFALQLWIEFGIFGAALGAILIVSILRSIWPLEPAQQRIALPVFIYGLAVSGIAYGLWQGWWLGLLFLAAGLTIMAIRIQVKT